MTKTPKNAAVTRPPGLTAAEKLKIARAVQAEMPGLNYLDLHDEIMRRIDFALP